MDIGHLQVTAAAVLQMAAAAGDQQPYHEAAGCFAAEGEGCVVLADTVASQHAPSFGHGLSLSPSAAAS